MTGRLRPISVEKAKGNSMKKIKVSAGEWAVLKKKDAKISAVMEALGPLERDGYDDLFSGLVRAVIGQQISSQAEMTVWNRLVHGSAPITPERLSACSPEQLRSFGMSGRKAETILRAAEYFASGDLSVSALEKMSDIQIVQTLTQIKGIGVWTAEMLMIFALDRRNILSEKDFGIRRGLRMIYELPEITPEQFRQFREHFAPYNTAASFYLWAAAAGKIPGLSDSCPKNK